MQADVDAPRQSSRAVQVRHPAQVDRSGFIDCTRNGTGVVWWTVDLAGGSWQIRNVLRVVQWVLCSIKHILCERRLSEGEKMGFWTRAYVVAGRELQAPFSGI